MRQIRAQTHMCATSAPVAHLLLEVGAILQAGLVLFGEEKRGPPVTRILPRKSCGDQAWLKLGYAENQSVKSDLRLIPGWWGMTSPVYSALPQELLLDAEPRRPGTKNKISKRAVLLLWLIFYKYICVCVTNIQSLTSVIIVGGHEGAAWRNCCHFIWLQVGQPGEDGWLREMPDMDVNSVNTKNKTFWQSFLRLVGLFRTYIFLFKFRVLRH